MIEGRVLVHLLGDGALGRAGDPIRLRSVGDAASLTTALSASGSLMLTASMIVSAGLRRHMIVQQLLNLRLELLEVDDLLIAELHRPLQLAELLPVPLQSLDLVLVEDIEELLRRQRDMQAPTEGTSRA